MTLLHVIPLLVRSAGFRGIVVWVTLGAAIAGLGLSASHAFTLSPEQQAEKYLGQAAALITPSKKKRNGKKEASTQGQSRGLPSLESRFPTKASSPCEAAAESSPITSIAS